MKQPNQIELGRRLADAKGKSSKVLLLELADAVIAETPRLAPIPKLAREWSDEIADRVRDRKAHVTNEGKLSERARQWDRWHSRIVEDVYRDGVRLLREIQRDAPEELARFDAICARVALLVRGLVELALPWWPTFRRDADDGDRALSIVDYAKRELGSLENWQIRRGAVGGMLPLFAPTTAREEAPSRSERDDGAAAMQREIESW